MNKSTIIMLAIIVIVITLFNGQKEGKKELRADQLNCTTDANCHPAGCNGHICANRDTMILSICEWKPEYDCYKKITCGCVDNQCQWNTNNEFNQCYAKSTLPCESTCTSLEDCKANCPTLADNYCRSLGGTVKGKLCDGICPSGGCDKWETLMMNCECLNPPTPR